MAAEHMAKGRRGDASVRPSGDGRPDVRQGEAEAGPRRFGGAPAVPRQAQSAQSAAPAQSAPAARGEGAGGQGARFPGLFGPPPAPSAPSAPAAQPTPAQRTPPQPAPPAQPVPPASGAGAPLQRPLDRVDRAILRLLQHDGRASVRSVAERVHVSRANAYARISRMVEDGVIRGFTARVDHERAGQGASAYITLKIVQNSWRTVRGQLLELPGVQHIALVSGEFDVLLLVHTADNRALRELVLHRIQALPAVLSTHTLLVFDETDRTPELPEP